MNRDGRICANAGAWHWVVEWSWRAGWVGGWAGVIGLWLLGAGCAGVAQRGASQPGQTTVSTPLTILPAQLMGNLMVVEVKWDRFGPYRFLIDTGSSVTMITPSLARRYGDEKKPSSAAKVRVAAADGGITELVPVSLRRLQLGEARFDDVAALIYDCAALSAHLGTRIDGVLGFPLFRETRLTMDYPGKRLLLEPARGGPPLPGTTLAFDDRRKTPLISVRLGDRSLVALIDSGSDAFFTLNPLGLAPRFKADPIVGGTVGIMGGERAQRLGRLGETLGLGEERFFEPIVEIADELSAIGGGLLRHFVVTFDQLQDRVTFFRDTRGAIITPARRSGGLSFTKTPAYWRVAGVVPGSPAARAEIQVGDLISRINGEPVAQWNLSRFEALVSAAPDFILTFWVGATETEKRVPVFVLVP